MNTFSDPEKNIEQFVLSEDRTVADLGAGTGAYTFAVSRRVGERGKVYAVDLQKPLLDKLKNEAHEKHLSNIQIVWGDIEEEGGTTLRDVSVDAVIIANMLFQSQKKDGVAKEAYRIARPEGRVLVIDWRESYGGIGPHPNDVVTQEDAKALFEKAGFVFEREIQAGAHHYGLIMRKRVR